MASNTKPPEELWGLSSIAMLKKLLADRDFRVPDDTSMMTEAFNNYRYMGRDMGRRGSERVEAADPNSAEGIIKLEEAAFSRGLRRPYTLSMTKRTWEELISAEAKEYVAQQIDEGLLRVVITYRVPDKEFHIGELD